MKHPEATVSPEDAFRYLISDAQEAYGNRKWEAAKERYDLAATVAPDDLEYARAIRGYAKATYRIDGFDKAIVPAREALEIHSRLIEEQPGFVRATKLLRHGAESATVVGTLALGEYCDLQIANELNRHKEREALLREFSGAFAKAWQWLEAAESESDKPDQHRINLAARYSAALTLSGNKELGAEIAKESLRLARKSESKKLPTSAKDLSFKYRSSTIIRAVARGFVAIRVNRLFTPIHGRNRDKAFRLTRRWIV